MKKLLGIVVLGFFLTGCVTKHVQKSSDGTTYTQYKINNIGSDFTECTMSSAWYVEARGWEVPERFIADCYTRKMEVYELCLEWDKVYDEYYDQQDWMLKFRKAISMSLIDRNVDPLKCRNPNKDNEFKLKKAEQRAADAEAKAAKAKSESQQQTCTEVLTPRYDGKGFYYKKVCN